MRESLWSNGEPVTAYDFEYSWKKAILSPYYGAILFSPIKNAGRCNDGSCTPDEVGIYVQDNQTLVVELEHPTPYFLELTSCVNYAPINERNKGLTNGPFYLKEWNLSESLILEKNPRYWDSEHIALPGVHFKIVPEESIRHEMFEKGQIDIIGDPLAPLFRDAIESGNQIDQVTSVPLNGMNLLVFNTKKYPFNNKNLRKALSYVISRETVSSHMLVKSKPPAMGLIASGKNNYIRDGDRVTAQLLLNSALAELGITLDELPEIVLIYCPVFYQPSIMHIIQQEWEETLGLKVVLDPVDKGHLYNQMLKGDFQIGSMFWVSIIEDPIYILDFFRSDHRRMNFSRWEDKKYEEILSAVNMEADLEKRKLLLEKAESYVMDEMPVAPICYASALYIKKDILKNITVSPYMDVNVKKATLENP